MKIGYLVVALAVVPAAVQAETWRVVASSEEYPAIVGFVDSDSIRRNGDAIEFVTQQISEGDTDKTDHRIVSRVHATCGELKYKVLSEDYYIGQTLQPGESPTEEWLAAPDNSIGQVSIDAACGKLAYVGEAVADPIAYADGFFAYLADEEEEAM